jgi:hypothetical protein
VFFTENYYGDKIDYEIGRPFMCGRHIKAYNVTVGRGSFKDLGIDDKIVIKCVLKKLNLRVWAEYIEWRF